MSTTRTGNARLLLLAKLLRTLPRKRFDYNRWVGYDWAGDPDLSCGTTACALGWATTIPALRRAGLRLVRGVGCAGYVTLRDFRTSPMDTYEQSLRAAMQVFGLTRRDAAFLFVPGWAEVTATPKYVARKIERFVERRR